MCEREERSDFELCRPLSLFSLLLLRGEGEKGSFARNC